MKILLNRERGSEKREGALRPAELLFNLVLIVVVLAAALASFFALLELVQYAAAHIIIRTNDSAVSSRYALASVRNIWLMAGGAGMVGIVIYLLDYGMKRWRTLRMRRLFLRILAVELVIIALQVAVTG